MQVAYSPTQTHLHRLSYSQHLQCCILFLVPPWPPTTGSSLPYLLEKATRRLLNFSLLSAFATIVSFSTAVAEGPR